MWVNFICYQQQIHMIIKFSIGYIKRMNQIIFIAKIIDANVTLLFNHTEIFFSDRNLISTQSRSLTIFRFAFVILSGCIFDGFKCLVWHQRKYLFSLILVLIRPFFLSFLIHQDIQCMYLLIMDCKYWNIYIFFIYGLNCPTRSFINQIIYSTKTVWKDFSKSYLGLIIVLVVEVKQTVVNCLSACSLYLLNLTKVGVGGVQWGPTLLVSLSSHENHFSTSSDAPRLLIKFLWAHINHDAKTFYGPGAEWCHYCQNYLQSYSDLLEIGIYNVNLCIAVHWL